ncbi:hypothetical protein [Herminiimonas arsenitoxidans]|uniref:hypothetical protein n=1 Tax=Herminiimonas arsenitoxidans TaxID=1809410 RepID=UPI000970DEDA|nr:hypothetical protein [Herminiimonas arsenitoxidans]
MSLETIGGFISMLITPLTTLIAEKLADRFGGKESTLRQVVIQCLAFVLLLIPVALLLIALIGMVIFSFQMLSAGF